jgi:hypothetical protein
MRRCFDRGFRRGTYEGLAYTRSVIQEDYEKINTGNELFMEYRYCNMLTVLSVCFTYSAGMPILYPIATLYFFISYWVEKLLVLRFYKKPVLFNGFLSQGIVYWFKYILCAHIVFAYLMFSNAQILKSSSTVIDDYGAYEGYYGSEQFFHDVYIDSERPDFTAANVEFH